MMPLGFIATIILVLFGFLKPMAMKLLSATNAN